MLEAISFVIGKNLWAVFVIQLLISVLMGLIAKGIAKKRGMKGEGFCWGFFLGVIGIIVIRCCPKY